MPTTTACPPVRELHRLVRAQTGDREAGRLNDHVAGCSRCLEILNVLREEAEGGRAPAPAAPPDSSGTWRNGVKPASAVLAPVQPAAPAAPPAVAPPARAAVDSTQEVLSCLAPPQAPDEIGRLGGYRVLHVLGCGATGVVFVAEDVQLQRRVALKVMRPAADAGDLARQRFLREARAAAVIDHEHIVTIYQVGEDRGAPYLAMKLLQGETLDERLKREGQLLVHEVLRIGREIAAGLAAAHEQGLIHRDIKPANLFLEAGSGRVKIVDFGLARAASHDMQLTRTGTVVGTPAYMSPEQARGIRVDHRSDLFSLGCVLYRMCTGRTPFQAEDTLGMLTALAQDQPAPIKAFNPTVPAELVGLISRLLAKVADARPQNAQSVAATLAAIEEQVAASRSSEYLKPRCGVQRGRGWWMTVMQVLIPAALAALIYWFGPSAFRMMYDQAQDAIETLPSAFSRR